ncbi:MULTISPECIES: cytochrome P450 [unclassified Streptomyces]|uniref:cytochrome P450 family protein n=1 Tax=unclassified Streptomyces TaxID=2593676 RepID=UPI0037F91524
MTTIPEPAFSLMGPEFQADPYTTTARLREAGPAVRGTFIDGEPCWMFLRDAEVRTILDDPRFVVNPASVPGGAVPDRRAEGMVAIGIDEEIARPYLAASMAELDAPGHPRLRKLASRAFTARRIAELRPRMEKVTQELLDALPGHAENGVVDLIEHFAHPLPLTVICDLIGVPEEDRPLWLEWSHAAMWHVRPGAMTLPEAMRAMVTQIRDLIARRRAEPADDLIDALIRVQDEDGDRLSDTELVMLLLDLGVAGHETTSYLIGTGTAALLTHPDQLSLLRSDLSLLPKAIHELMRWCTPVMLTRPRHATVDLDLGGVPIAAGERVMAILIGANRDPRRFPDADRLDITRTYEFRGEQHVGFSHGPHYCLGAGLAKEEGEIAFGALLRKYPGLTLAVDESAFTWQQPHPGMRRLAELPVRL